MQVCDYWHPMDQTDVMEIDFGKVENYFTDDERACEMEIHDTGYTPDIVWTPILLYK